MGLKQAAHRIALRGEAVFDRIVPTPEGTPVLEAYKGYATPEHLILRGRVLSAVRKTNPSPESSKWANFKQMASLFLTNEVADVPVTVDGRGITGRSDEEGYITLEVPREGRPAGWHDVMARVADGPPVAFPVLIPEASAAFGVISDVDDTMMRTGAYSLARNLWTTFTGSALTREIFADSIDLMRRLTEAGDAPVYYVSSSPWNLHAFLDRVFERAGLVNGPMFLRDLGIGEKQFITGTHGDHKGSAIDRILEANPGLRFVMIGDTGQHDAEIYRAAASRHPGRIAAVLLREPGPGPSDAVQTEVEHLRETGLPVFTGATFDGAAEKILAEIV